MCQWALSLLMEMGPHKEREKLWAGWELNHGQRLQKRNPSLYLYIFIAVTFTS